MCFDRTYEFTKKFEGGYVNDPTDRGGETFRGISRKSWPCWDGWEMVDDIKEKFGNNPAAIDGFFFHNFEMDCLVEDFYFENFWTPVADFGLPNLLTAKLFDTSVNLGKKGGVKVLQKTLNQLDPTSQLDVDGKYGPKTSQAAFQSIQSKDREDEALTIFSYQQSEYYKDIVANNPSQKKYLNGWLRRAAWRPE